VTIKYQVCEGKRKNPEIPCFEALNVPPEGAEGFSWGVKVQHGGLKMFNRIF
jgi:hypothetical protein